MTQPNANDIVTALDRSMRRVRLSLVLYGVPCLISLAGLGLRGALSGLSPNLPGYLEIAATLTAVGLLLVIVAGWLATRRALRQLDLKLRESNSRLTLNRQEIEAAKARHALERKIKTMELEHAVAIREARLRIRELDRTLERAPAQEPAGAGLPAGAGPPAGAGSPAGASTRRPPPAALNRPRRILPEADRAQEAAAGDENA